MIISALEHDNSSAPDAEAQWGETQQQQQPQQQ
jgi:hypothetical protein